MRSTMLAVLALSAAITTQAKADYVWRFDVSKAVAGTPSFPGFIPEPGYPNRLVKSWIPSFAITITDAAFARGTVDIGWSGCYAGPGSCFIPPHGDLSSLVSMTGGNLTPPGGWGFGAIDLSFNKHGRLSGSFDLEGDVDDLSMSGGRVWTGIYGSDANECGMTVPRCEITGRWKFLGDPPAGETSAPEPASIAMLIAGLAGLVFVKQKRRREVIPTPVASIA